MMPFAQCRSSAGVGLYCQLLKMGVKMRTIVFLLLALSVVSLMPTKASAEWYCLARARNGSWGEGWAPARATAQAASLVECALHTPSAYTCYVTSCVAR